MAAIDWAQVDDDWGLTIKFDGEGLKGGAILVDDLAVSLGAFTVIVRTASLTLTGEPDGVRILVNSDFQSGSFLIKLRAVPHAVRHSLQWMVTDRGFRITELIVGKGGLIALLLMLNGQQPARAIDTGDDSVIIHVQDSDDTEIEIGKSVYNLYLDYDARVAAYNLVSPLQRNGIDYMEFQSENEAPLRVTKDKIHCFENIDSGVPEEILTEQVREQAFTIVSPVFRPRLKWRLDDGSSVQNVRILDEAFEKEVLNGHEAFRAGDTLIAKVVTRQWRMSNGRLKAETEIIEVLKHIAAPSQRKLFDE